MRVFHVCFSRLDPFEKVWLVTVHVCVSLSPLPSHLSVWPHRGPLPATEQLLEFMHQLPAFANMTMSVRRDLCGVMVFEVVEQDGTIVLHDKQEVTTHTHTHAHVHADRHRHTQTQTRTHTQTDSKETQ